MTDDNNAWYESKDEGESRRFFVMSIAEPETQEGWHQTESGRDPDTSFSGGINAEYPSDEKIEAHGSSLEWAKAVATNAVIDAMTETYKSVVAKEIEVVARLQVNVSPEIAEVVDYPLVDEWTKQLEEIGDHHAPIKQVEIEERASDDE